MTHSPVTPAAAIAVATLLLIGGLSLPTTADTREQSARRSAANQIDDHAPGPACAVHHDDVGLGYDAPDEALVAGMPHLPYGAKTACLAPGDSEDHYRVLTQAGDDVRVRVQAPLETNITVAFLNAGAMAFASATAPAGSTVELVHEVVDPEPDPITVRVTGLQVPASYGIEHACPANDLALGADATEADPLPAPSAPARGCTAEVGELDHYTIEADAGEAFTIRFGPDICDRTYSFARLLDGDRNRVTTIHESRVCTPTTLTWWSAEAQTFTLEVERLDHRYTYTYVLSVERHAISDPCTGEDADSGRDSTDSDPIRVHGSLIEGCLNPPAEQGHDAYEIYGLAGEVLTVTLEQPFCENLWIRIKDAGYAVTGERYRTCHPDPITWRLDQSGWLRIDVFAYETVTDYTLSISRDAGGLRLADELPLDATLIEDSSLDGSLVACPDGVHLTRWNGVWTVDETGLSPTDIDLKATDQVACDASGAHYAYEVRRSGIARADANGAGWFTDAYSGDVAFGPDGALYKFLGTSLVRFTPDRAREIDLTGVPASDEDIAFAPDGDLFYIPYDGAKVLELDLGTGDVTVAADFSFTGSEPEALAFDANGIGNAAVGGDIHAFDPETGRTLHVADTEIRADEIAFHGSTLFVQGSAWWTDAHLSYIEMPVEGFEGFQPTFDVDAPGDVEVTITDVRSPPLAFGPGVSVPVPPMVLESREMDVELSNHGPSAVTGFVLMVYSEPRNCANGLEDETGWTCEREYETRLDSEAAVYPGQPRTETVSWPGLSDLGDKRIIVEYHPLSPEADQTNNQDATDSSFHVGGFGGWL